MSELPSPDDVAVQLLTWLSAPGIVIVIVTSLVTILGWVSFLRTGVHYATSAALRTRQTIQYWTSDRQRAFVRLTLASTFFLAVFYSLVQLAQVTYERTGSGYSIAEGLVFDTRYLMSRLMGYSHWTPLSKWCTLGCLASLVALNLTNLAGMPSLRKALVGVWGLALGLGALAGCLIAFSGLCVLLLGLTHSDNYTTSMVTLYVLWAACLWSLPWLGTKISENSEALFRS